jgi:hypothetical protein
VVGELSAVAVWVAVAESVYTYLCMESVSR